MRVLFSTYWSRGDVEPLVGLAVQSKDPSKLALVAEELSFAPYALAMPRNDSAFRLEVNKALTQVYVGGDIERIFGQWLGKLGRPTGFRLTVNEVYPVAGAGFVVAQCGEVMTMPGLPKVPAAENMKIHPDGSISGLS